MTGRQLILIRHAKAAAGALDLERALTPRGRRDASALGRLLVRDGIFPDLAVVSPARRARQTWDGAQAELPGIVESVIDDRIYDNHVAALLGVINDTTDVVRSLALVGHNPGFAELAELLDDGRGEPDARQRLLVGYPTSAVAVLDVAVPWDEVRAQSATLTAFSVPRADT